jgi:hypothetical protein
LGKRGAKTGIFKDAKEEGYQHAHASVTSQATFWWLTPLLWRGSRKPLELEDLGQLPAEESTQRQFNIFKKHYDSEKVSDSSFYNII